jgi:hypothetical protein
VVLLTGFILYAYNVALFESGSAHVDFTLGSVHTVITIEKEGETVLQEYHAGAVTNLGLNLTFAKLFGNSTSYNMTSYNLNLTQIGIGNQGSLSTSSVILPGEWNRTAADTQHSLSHNTGNWTVVIYPDALGPYTADCLGVYYEGGSTNSLFLYDTFTEVSGIDETFTITLEIQLSAS